MAPDLLGLLAMGATLPFETRSPEAEAARPHVCRACGRRFMVIGDRSSMGPRCLCGEGLSLAWLPRGVYEIRRGRRASRHRRAPAASAPPLREPDLGYGESHGYGPAHGGPSGPGDAPADEAIIPDGEPPPSAVSQRPS